MRDFRGESVKAWVEALSPRWATVTSDSESVDLVIEDARALGEWLIAWADEQEGKA